MRLVHWSADIVTEVHGRYQVKSEVDKKRKGGVGKPLGFWLSVEDRGAHGWRAWCRSERFKAYGFRYEHEIKLVENAKILYLRTPEDIDWFTDEYRDQNSRTNAIIAHIGDKPDTMDIDWHRVAKKYHGIIITPYQWERRLGMSCTWYYGWDCASGCIWNKRAIKSVTMVKERKVPRKPTYWEERRAQKRRMKKMRDLMDDMKIPRPSLSGVEK